MAAQRAGHAAAARRAHRGGDRARRRAGGRHVRAHRLDHRRLQLDLLDDLPGHRRDGHRAQRASTPRPAGAPGANGDVAVVLPVAARRGCRRCPEVKDAIGDVSGSLQLDRQRQGDHLRRGAQPRLQRRPVQAPVQLAEAGQRQLAGRDRVVIDTTTAEQEESSRRPGRSGVQGVGPVVRAEDLRAGQVRLGVARSAEPPWPGFELPTAQRLFGKVGKLDEIRVSAKPGVSPKQLVAADPPGPARRHAGAHRRPAGPAGLVVDHSFLTFLKTFLLVFAGVALFVGSFVIANSLSITIAQRTREFATLRTLGASREQVLRSILVESLVIGVIASVIGLLVGLALAQGLFALFNAAGVTLPNTGTVVEAAHDHRRDPGRRRRHGAGQPAPGAAGHAGRADRRRARGRDPPRGAAGALPHRHRRRHRDRSASSRWCSACSWPAAPAPCSASWASARSSSSSASRCSRRGIVPRLATWLGWPATKIAGAIGELARENTHPQPAAHRLHGVGADDRPRARHASSPCCRRGSSPTSRTR